MLEMFNLHIAQNIPGEGSEFHFEPISARIRIDWQSRAVYVLNALPSATDEPWESTKIDLALLPPTGLTQRVGRLVNNDRFFELFLLGLDLLAGRSGGDTKSFHKTLMQFSRVFVKTVEFAFVKGFYDLQDIPMAVWEDLRSELALGGWCKALDIRSRTATRLSQIAWHPDLFLNREKTKNAIHLKVGFSMEVGTNLAGPELRVMRNMVIQASNNIKIWRSGDVSCYEQQEDKKASADVLSRTLALIDILAQVSPGKAVQSLPGGSNYLFSLQNGRPGARTENMDPQSWGSVLMHAYHWIIDLGPKCHQFVDSLITAQLNFAHAGGLLGKNPKDVTKLRRKILASLPERNSLEIALNLKISTFKSTAPKDGETSVLEVIMQLYSACFIVLASMNARRKDEIIGRAIGVHVESLRKVDEVFDLYECEFYMEKKIRAYSAHYVNDISRIALELMRKFSDIAWCLADSASTCTVGRARKLFVVPRYFVDGGRSVQWFTFDNGTTRKGIINFVKSALPNAEVLPNITPHMFRRAYGLLYHYRYENAQLVALSQKYGHVDVEQTMHYLTDRIDTEHGKTAIAKWAVGRGLSAAEKHRRKEIDEIVRGVGEQKLRDYIAEVVDSSRRFSGGFAKLVARFHRKMGNSVNYESLDRPQNASSIADVFIERGHKPRPYPWGTCMSGETRKHSACSSGPGHVTHENASPHTCGRCPYSDTTIGHLENMKQDEKILAEMTERPESILQKNFAIELVKLRRIIELHSSRLGFSE